MLAAAMALTIGDRRARAADADGGDGVDHPPPVAAFEPEPKPPSSVTSPAPTPVSTAASFGSFAPTAPVGDEPPRGDEQAVVRGPAHNGHASDDSSADDAPERTIAHTGSCDGPVLLRDDVARCNTPRGGTLSGGYLGVDVGFVAPKAAAADRVGVSGGFAGTLRFGAELWDELIIGIGFDFFDFGDNRPTSELVVTCTTVNNVKTACDNDPHLQSSSVTAIAGSLEAGYQRRFRPSRRLSVSVGALAGYMQGFGRMKRGVDCEGCSSSAVDAIASGLYANPFLRVTFGHTGEYAFILRTQWFATGDLLQLTTVGFELGAP